MFVLSVARQRGSSWCLAAFCSAFATLALAQGATALPDAGLVEKFDNWEIRQTPGEKSYFLIGQPTDDTGQLWLQCERKRYLTVAVSMGGKGGRQGVQKTQTVTLQVDKVAPRDFSFLVFESFVALATEVSGTGDSRVSAFLDALRDVKTNLVITYDQTSHEFDVTQLQNARLRFLELCGRNTASQ